MSVLETHQTYLEPRMAVPSYHNDHLTLPRFIAHMMISWFNKLLRQDPDVLVVAENLSLRKRSSFLSTRRHSLGSTA